MESGGAFQPIKNLLLTDNNPSKEGHSQNRGNGYGFLNYRFYDNH